MPVTPEQKKRYPSNFQDKLEGLRHQILRGGTAFHSTLTDLEEMARGGDVEGGVRERYYPGWENEDFENLVEAGKQEYERLKKEYEEEQAKSPLRKILGKIGF